MSVWPKLSCFDQAADLISSLAGDDLTENDILSQYELSFGWSKPKGYAMIHHNKVKSISAVLFKGKCERLVKYVQASYKDNENLGDREKFPFWLDSQKYHKRAEQLIKMFQVTLMAVHHVFGFKEKDDVLGFCRNVFKDVTTLTGHYTVVEHLLRVFPDEWTGTSCSKEDKKMMEDRKKSCLDEPEKTVSVVKKLARTIPPEPYRNKLIEAMRTTLKYKRNLSMVEDILFCRDTRFRLCNAMILRLKVLICCFHKPYDESKSMCLQHGDRVDMILEANRHKESEKKAEDNSTVDDNETTDEMHNQNDIENESSSDDVNVCIGHLFETSDDDADDQIGCENKFQFGCAVDESDNNEMQYESEDTNELDQLITADVGITQPVAQVINTAGQTGRPIQRDRLQPLEENHAHAELTTELAMMSEILVIGHPKTKYMRENCWTMTCVTADGFHNLIELSILDVVYHLRSTVVPHPVFIAEQCREKMWFRADVGHAWFPSKKTHIGYDFGVIRSSHAILRPLKERIDKKVDFGLIFAYLMAEEKPGKTSKMRQIDIKKIESFELRGVAQGIKLKENVAVLLDVVQDALDTAYKVQGHTPLLCDIFLFDVSSDDLHKMFGCKSFRFSSFAISITMITSSNNASTVGVRSNSSNEEHAEGNHVSGTLSCFFLVEDANMDGKHIFRFSITVYTKRAYADLKSNELVLSDLKEGVKNLKRRTNESYSKVFPNSTIYKADFTHPWNIYLTNELGWKSVVLKEGTSYESIHAVSSYCKEISASSGLTIIRRVYLKIKDDRKMMELLLVALFCGAWEIYYIAGIDFLESTEIDWQGNLTVQLSSLMDTLGNWKSGKFHRGHITHIDFTEIYSDATILRQATDAMHEFLQKLEHANRMDLPTYKKMLANMIDHIPGVDLFTGQNLALFAACTGIVLKDNGDRGTLAFPVDDDECSTDIEDLNKKQTQVLDEELCRDNIIQLKYSLEGLKLHSSPNGFMQTARLFCRYAGISSVRSNWAERGLYDGLQKEERCEDTFVKGQSLFFLENVVATGEFVAKEKKYGNKYYSPLLAVDSISGPSRK